MERYGIESFSHFRSRASGLSSFRLVLGKLHRQARWRQAGPALRRAAYKKEWFEVMRLDHRFERGPTNVTTTYTCVTTDPSAC
jgi:lipocalin